MFSRRVTILHTTKDGNTYPLVFDKNSKKMYLGKTPISQNFIINGSDDVQNVNIMDVNDPNNKIVPGDDDGHWTIESRGDKKLIVFNELCLTVEGGIANLKECGGGIEQLFEILDDDSDGFKFRRLMNWKKWKAWMKLRRPNLKFGKFPPVDFPNFDFPDFALPNFKMPSFDLKFPKGPKVNFPKFNKPNFDWPNYKSPNFDWPNYKLPHWKSPNFDWPNYKSPNFDWPNMKSPNFDWPNYKLPNWKSPDFDWPNIKSPNFDWSNWKAPDFDWPNMKSPNFNWPHMKLPRFKRRKHSHHQKIHDPNSSHSSSSSSSDTNYSEFNSENSPDYNLEDSPKKTKNEVKLKKRMDNIAANLKNEIAGIKEKLSKTDNPQKSLDPGKICNVNDIKKDLKEVLNSEISVKDDTLTKKITNPENIRKKDDEKEIDFSKIFEKLKCDANMKSISEKTNPEKMTTTKVAPKSSKAKKENLQDLNSESFNYSPLSGIEELIKEIGNDDDVFDILNKNVNIKDKEKIENCDKKKENENFYNF